MKAIVVTPKNDDEFKFVASLLKKLGVNSAPLSQDDLENIGLSSSMRRVDKNKKASRAEIMKKLSAWCESNFQRSFQKTSTDSVKQNLRRIIELMESADSLDKISNLKKLKGHKSAYRVRVGDYRMDFFFENSTILIGRFLHRKEIYKMFP